MVLARRLAILALVLALPLGAISIAGTADETYTPTIDVSEAVGIGHGLARLEKTDPQYCEKQRDLCLIGICGSFERKNVVDSCWIECTTKRYSRCTAERSQ